MYANNIYEVIMLIKAAIIYRFTFVVFRLIKRYTTPIVKTANINKNLPSSRIIIFFRIFASLVSFINSSR